MPNVQERWKVARLEQISESNNGKGLNITHVCQNLARVMNAEIDTEACAGVERLIVLKKYMVKFRNLSDATR